MSFFPLFYLGKREAAVRESEEERRGRASKKKESGGGKETAIRGDETVWIWVVLAAPFVISPDLFDFLLTGLLCALSKREERLQKVLQARERVEQLEEEKKKRLEQKLAQHEEKNEKVNAVRELLGKMGSLHSI